MLLKKLFNRPEWALLLIVVLIFIAYAMVMTASFKTQDDQVSIVENKNIQSFANAGKVFQAAFFGDRSYYRPLVSLSFMAEYSLFGLKPAFYYLTNILLHCANTLMVFFLASYFLRDRSRPLMVALLFAIHPVHWEAVSNIPGRSIILSAFFYLGSLSAFFSYKEKKNVFFLALSVIWFALALLCKESAVMLPVVIGLYLWLFEPRREGRKPGPFIALVPFLLVIALYAVIRQTLGITEIFRWQTPETLALGFLTFLRGVITYLRLFFFPVDLHFDRAQQVFVSFLDIELLWTMVFYLGLSICIWSQRKKMKPLMVFMIAWFALELFPVAQILSAVGVQPGSISLAEHFLYLPSISMFVMIVCAGQWICDRITSRKILAPSIVRVLVFGIFAALFLTTVQNNIYATSELAMLRRSLDLQPHNNRLLYSLGLVFAKEKEFSEAEKYFRSILETDPQNNKVRIALGKSLCDQGKYWEGSGEYEKVTDGGKYQELLADNLRLTYGILIDQQKEMIGKEPANPKTHYALGILYSKVNRPQEAVLEFQKAVELDPANKNAVFNLASTQEALKNREEARLYYEKTLALGGPEEEIDYHAAMHLGSIYEEDGNFAEAKKYIDLASRIRAELKGAGIPIP